MSAQDPARYRPDLGDTYPADETPIQRLHRFVVSTDVVISPREWRVASAAVLHHLNQYQNLQQPELPKTFGTHSVKLVTWVSVGMAIILSGLIFAAHYYGIYVAEAVVVGLVMIRIIALDRETAIQQKLVRELVEGVKDVIKTIR